MTPGKDDVAFDLEHLVDNGQAFGWPRRTERVYLERCPWEDGSPWFCCRRLADGLLLGAGETKQEAVSGAAYALQRLPAP